MSTTVPNVQNQTGSAESPEPGALPEELRNAAAGEQLTAGEEKDALDFLLGPTPRLSYHVTVQYMTQDGLKPLTFHFLPQDPSKFEELDAANRKGDGPFAKLDSYGYVVDVIVEATTHISGASGRKVDIRSAEFLGGVPAPHLALMTRFRGQGGLLESVVEEIRKVSGYNADRVGTAQRSMVEAGKG